MRRRNAVMTAVGTALDLAVPGGLAVLQGRDSCAGVDVVFDGYGSVTCSADAVTLSPQAATSDDVTHAALASLPGTATGGSEARTVTATVVTTEQLRDGTPNPWEVGWLLWSYTDPEHFYALVLKPNGWEVSKQDTAYEGSQRFLASGQERTFPVGTTHTATVALTPAPGALTMDVTVDGEHLATVTDEHSPYTTGTVALYCEDATVTFTGVGAATTAPTTP